MVHDTIQTDNIIHDIRPRRRYMAQRRNWRRSKVECLFIYKKKKKKKKSNLKHAHHVLAGDGCSSSSGSGIRTWFVFLRKRQRKGILSLRILFSVLRWRIVHR